ncbi:CBS domain-containing protein [Streptomyces sp. NPDC091027]|uniref:CBS domain-containing protein n=1 Tax=Streptomyces sp. NPDC091027 TaxID=3365971 RepID=UPI00382F520B
MGEREQAALDDGLLIVGWAEVGDLTTAATREEVRARVDAAYPSEATRVVANWTGQLLRFRSEIQVGDLVVMPLRSWRLAIGVVRGEYDYRPDAPHALGHVRSVEWLRRDVERSQIRQDLLDSLGSLLTIFELSRYNACERVRAIADGGDDPGRPDADPFVAGLTSPTKLYRAVGDREAHDPLRLSIRDFLAVWDATRRHSAVVEQIEQDLALQGLTTSPPFTEGSVDSEITVLPLGEEPDESSTSAVRRSGVSVTEEDDQQPVSYLVSNVDSANRTPVSVTVGASLQSAMTLMVLHGFSQLPVLDEEGRLRGVISWETIGRARMGDPGAELAAATERRVREADRSDDLLEWINEIYQSGYVFVRDQDLKVCGLITAADLTVQFGTRVRPFVLIEEVEQRLRRVVDARIPLERIRAVVRRRPDAVNSASNLSFGDYKFLLLEDSNWQALGWAADRELLLTWLEQCRNFRNDLMHFSPDPLTEEQMNPVLGLLNLLRSLEPHA